MDDIIQIDPLGFVMFYGQLTHTPTNACLFFKSIYEACAPFIMGVA